MNVLPIVMRLRDIHREELETQEGVAQKVGGNNDTKYNTAYYKRRVAGAKYKWCVVYQWWCFQKAGVPTSIFPRTAGVAAVRAWYEKKDRFFSKPQVGDLVIYKESHIGFVEKLLSEGRIQTIEGNWDDKVARRKMSAKDARIAGFCRPDYAGVKDPARSPLGITETILQGLPNLVMGDSGPDVRRLHGLLLAAGQKLGDAQNADGSFSRTFTEATRIAVRAETGRTTITEAQWKQLLGV